MKKLAMVLGTLTVLGAAAPAGASTFEIYIRGDGGFEYLDMTYLDYSGAMDPSNYDPSILTADQRQIMDTAIKNATKNYSGEGWMAGGSAGILLLDFIDVGVDFRQAGLYFDNGATADLTQLVLHLAWHFLGTEMIVDPSILLGFGYSYLTTPGPSDTIARTATPTGRGDDQRVRRSCRSGARRPFHLLVVGVAVDFVPVLRRRREHLLGLHRHSRPAQLPHLAGEGRTASGRAVLRTPSARSGGCRRPRPSPW